MKRVVLCEGKRDVKFLTTYYQLQSEDIKLKRFFGEEVSHTRLKNDESAEIRNFQEPRNPYHVLIKSENGVEELKRVFTKLVDWLVRSDLNLCLLIDLDHSPYEALISDLDHRVQSTYEGKELRITHDARIGRGKLLRGCVCQLTADNAIVGDFNVLAFHSNLEEAAMITADESDEEETAKLRAFLECTRRESILQDIL